MRVHPRPFAGFAWKCCSGLCLMSRPCREQERPWIFLRISYCIPLTGLLKLSDSILNWRCHQPHHYSKMYLRASVDDGVAGLQDLLTSHLHMIFQSCDFSCISRLASQVTAQDVRKKLTRNLEIDEVGQILSQIRCVLHSMAGY